MKQFFAFICGSLFAIGLMLSGMSNPAKVLAFLDVFGDWNPSLAFVMGGAILVAFLPFQYAVKHSRVQTVFHEPIELPSKKTLDAPLVTGALLFGIGWGLSGICPAPAITLIGLGHFEIGYFIASMLVGMVLYHFVMER
ncbi:DUF6691 family protein [Acinetobacter sp.]|uniref:DUF6691 family protein n=1 Tax=Acinetobacter sp. TaxID=472 RepID=UPI0031D73E79